VWVCSARTVAVRWRWSTPRTSTPGTVSADLSADGRALLVHCLEAPDPEGVVATIKERYERRLREIFES